MGDVLAELKDLYWASRGLLLFGAGALVAVTQLVLLIWTVRNLGEIAHLRERLSRLADGLALLTDTTEAGLTALSEEVRRADRADVRRADRGVVRQDGNADVRRADRVVARQNADAPATPKRRASTRANVARRIAIAARKGERPGAIAEREAISESEVRLHLALADGDAAGRAKQKRAS